MILLAGLIGGQPAQAAPAAPAAPPQSFQEKALPLAGQLNPDGSLNLNSGFTGALDPAGFRMEYAPDGAPRFKPVQPYSLPAPKGAWNALGSGLNGLVLTIAVAGANVYVGGQFTDAGGNLSAGRLQQSRELVPVIAATAADWRSRSMRWIDCPVGFAGCPGHPHAQAKTPRMSRASAYQADTF
jgi:hypothetical protein